ncbi:MAG: class I SAM-dependent methyltransferase [Candidatus Methanomethylicus sp.]|nr:class I SAM-dependent methyltransferase [Candidatus Methanomethylicus sp.]
MRDDREAAQQSSRSYYSHLAYYLDLLVQRYKQADIKTKRELDFIEAAFRAHASHPVKEVLDVACGNGPHVVGLAKRGYHCTGQDFTPERVQMAKTRAEREGVGVRLLQGDATELQYDSEFDAVLALYLLFLLPNDDDILKCLRQAHQALRPGGVLVCNIGNPFYLGKIWFTPQSIGEGSGIQKVDARGMHYMSFDQVKDYDPIRGVVWWDEVSVVEAPDGTHVFRDRERLRLLTYWDMINYLRAAGFQEIKCYPDWVIKSPKKPKAQYLVFVSRKA